MTDPINIFQAAFNRLYGRSAYVVAYKSGFTVYESDDDEGQEYTADELKAYADSLNHMADSGTIPPARKGSKPNIDADVDVDVDVDEPDAKPDDALDKMLAEMGTAGMLGMIVWYSVHKGSYPVSLLQGAADVANADGDLPGVVLEYLNNDAGESPDGAFRAVTRTGTRGVQTYSGEPHTITSYHTESIPDIDGAVLVAMKTVSKDGDDDGDIDAEHVGTILHDPENIDPASDGLVWRAEPKYAGDPNDPNMPELLKRRIVDLQNMIATMRHDYADRVGKINDVQVRQNIIIPWLKSRYRITLRGKGGVYLVPFREEINEQRRVERDKLQREIMALRQWLESSQIGILTAVGVFDGKATTIDFQRSALAEVKDEITDIKAMLAKHKANKHAPSAKAAAKRIRERIGALNERIEYITSSLGDDLRLKEINVAVLESQADKLFADTSAQIASARNAAKVAKSKGKGGSTGRYVPSKSPDDPIIIAGRKAKKQEVAF